jgi:hypothetical protein
MLEVAQKTASGEQGFQRWIMLISQIHGVSEAE